MTVHHHARTALRRGQSLHLYAGRGATIVAAAGAVRVDYAPAWLGEQMMQEKVSVREGEAHFVRRPGWLAVFSQSEGAMVCVIQREQIRARMRALFARLVFRRRTRRASSILHDAV